MSPNNTLQKSAYFTSILWAILLFAACSKEDDNSRQEITAIQPSFEVVGVDLEATYQYNYDGTTEMGTVFNLTDEIGVPSEFLTIRQVGSVISFYSFAFGDFSLYQKDVVTGATNSFPSFYTNTPQRSIVWGTNNEEAVFFGFYNPQGTRNLAVRKLTLGDLEGADLPLEFNIDALYQPLYADGRLFITYRSNDLQYKIAVYDTDNGVLISTLNYGTASPSLLIDENGNLAVLRFSDESVTILERRDIDDLTVIEEIPLVFEQTLPTGPINGNLIGAEFYYEYEYQQPFELINGPAVFNIDTGENFILDVAGIKNRLENEQGISIYIIASQYDETADVFLVSYGKFNTTQTLEGGVLAISKNGELLANAEVPFIPVYFIK
ncbi:hypothetical protein [Maribacter aestuarii]|uniref:hypothetical protein n=1 Tax=Maribacter aestuarii TaxID=1130723 RepID=UPI00248A9F4D|nr:hypothetical protein [Maribacter aestuarii]